jgi:hypothetical protein
VTQSVGAQTTVYVYDAFGALAAAYSNGGMGAPPCPTCYLTYDHLGTPRLITDSSASEKERWQISLLLAGADKLRPDVLSILQQPLPAE